MWKICPVFHNSLKFKTHFSHNAVIFFKLSGGKARIRGIDRTEVKNKAICIQEVSMMLKNKNQRNEYEERFELTERTPKRSGRKALFAAGALLAAGAFAGGTVAGSMWAPLSAAASEAGSLPTYGEGETAAQDNSAEQETFAETGNQETTAQKVNGLPDVSDIVEQCMPSVVAITNTIEVTTTTSGYGWFFSESGQSQSQTQEREAYGSGVIIGQNDEELLIVTNNHVAVYDESGSNGFYEYNGNTKSLSVKLVDGTEHEAFLKGTDQEADLAVISVALSDLSEETKEAIRVATIGDSDTAKIGQGVIAIGNALGMGQSTTIGYISALNREVTTEDGITRTLMQVDAAINGGNSGGGLFNGNGELIGINSAKYSSVGVEGIGYAIPISSALDIIEDLKVKTTKIALTEGERGYLGIRGDDVSSAYVSYGYPEGAQVIQITEGSPAAVSGLQLGDIITAVDGEKVTSYTALRTQLSYYAPGDTVELTVQRINGNKFEEKVISVTLSTRDSIAE